MRAFVALLVLAPLVVPSASAAPVSSCGVGGLYCVETEVADAALACVREADVWTCTWSGVLRGLGSTGSSLPGETRLGVNAYATLSVCGELGCDESYEYIAASCSWGADGKQCAFERPFLRTVTLPAGAEDECLWADSYAFTGATHARPPGSPLGFASAVDRESRVFTSGPCG